MTMDVKTIREGGNNGDADPPAPGRSATGTLTLKRGMTASFDLWDWFERGASATRRCAPTARSCCSRPTGDRAGAVRARPLRAQ